MKYIHVSSLHFLFILRLEAFKHVDLQRFLLGWWQFGWWSCCFEGFSGRAEARSALHNFLRWWRNLWFCTQETFPTSSEERCSCLQQSAYLHFCRSLMSYLNKKIQPQQETPGRGCLPLNFKPKRKEEEINCRLCKIVNLFWKNDWWVE